MHLDTVFHPRSAPLNVQGAWEEWYGYRAASVFADFLDIEYSAVRDAVGVIDVSPAGMTAAVVNRYLEIKERGAL